MTQVSVSMLVFLVALIPLTGGLLAITPWLMRRGECFAVTVPDAAQQDARLRGFKRSYALMVLGVSAACTLAMALFAGANVDAAGTLKNEAALVVALVAFLLVPVLAGFGLMLHFRRKVQTIKKAEGWTAKSQQSAALIAEGDVPRAIPLAWNLLYLPVLLVTLALLAVFYPSMPDDIPMQVNLAGEVTTTMPKGPAVFAFPLVTVAFMAVIMMACHLGIVHSKRPTEPGAPATSAYAYGMFMRAQSVFLLAAGLLIAASVGWGFALSAAQLMSLEQMGACVMAMAFLIVVGAIVMSVVYGQAGSRLYRRLGDAGVLDELAFDDDAHWKLGVFYWNKDDASLFLPKRFGIGWTINLGRPAAWVAIVGFFALTGVFMAAVFAITGQM